jgi:hypothetical protein
VKWRIGQRCFTQPATGRSGALRFLTRAHVNGYYSGAAGWSRSRPDTFPCGEPLRSNATGPGYTMIDLLMLILRLDKLNRRATSADDRRQLAKRQ